MTTTGDRQEPTNYLIGDTTPSKQTEEFYEFEKLTKVGFGEVWGEETHKRRRRLILQRHPEVAKLLQPTKPYSIILAFILVPLGLATCYLVKVD